MEKFRMYGFVPYNISEIQKGIQFGHAVVEYSLKYGTTDEYLHWAKNDKTFIILNGGTTRQSLNQLDQGTMNSLKDELTELGINIAEFYEPDLNNALSAIVFLVPDQVFDKETYPDFDWEYAKSLITGFNSIYNEWMGSIGGEKNAKLRELLSKYRLA